MQMTPQRWDFTKNYLLETFGRQGEGLDQLKREAAQSGLPEIAISADVGHLLSILVAGTEARCAIEVGTLGGYSATWIARALVPEGRLITIECEARYADFAQTQLQNLGLSEKVEVRRGYALEVLAELRQTLEPGSVDVLFFDALKSEYPKYWELARPMLKEGGLLIADNTLGTSEWWIDDISHPDRAGVDLLNRTVAADPAFEATLVPLREGVLIARRSRT